MIRICSRVLAHSIYVVEIFMVDTTLKDSEDFQIGASDSTVITLHFLVVWQ